jgi:hypothetical protein
MHKQRQTAVPDRQRLAIEGNFCRICNLERGKLKAALTTRPKSAHE